MSPIANLNFFLFFFFAHSFGKSLVNEGTALNNNIINLFSREYVCSISHKHK